MKAKDTIKRSIITGAVIATAFGASGITVFAEDAVQQLL